MKPVDEAKVYLNKVLEDADVNTDRIEHRSFPEELWLIAYVPQHSLVTGQSLAGSIEQKLNAEYQGEDTNTFWVVTFRPMSPKNDTVEEVSKSRLASRNVDQLIQLLEARSRTSDALPSLNYVEDPRASLAAVGASRHHLIYGRRGVGKTALLLEAKRVAESQGHITVWCNAHVVRRLDPATAFTVLAENVLSALARHGGTSSGEAFTRLQQESDELLNMRKQGTVSTTSIDAKLPDLNSSLRSVLRGELVRLHFYIDDFYLFPIRLQPILLDYLAAMLRDCDGWMKVASIERLTRPFEPSSKVGLEVPHDASVIDLDVTLEDPSAAQHFLQSVLTNYTRTANIKQVSSIAKPEALGRLVLASGGVPRDYLNLFASSIVIARSARRLAREVGKEDVAVAAESAARGKKRDLELDVSSDNARSLIDALETLAGLVKGKGFTYFLINISQKSLPNYELIGQLVDLRFAHLVQAALSDQHRPGVRYEAYLLDLSEFTDVRLKRGLNVLDLEDGRWTWRLTGKAGTMQHLSGTDLRDRLRQAPIVNMDGLTVEQ